MIYFDIRQPLWVLPDEDKGKLFDAILEYGEFGTLPNFDGMLAMAWGFIQPKLDRDGENYENTVSQRKYAAFCKKLNGLNLPKVSFEEWKEMPDFERERMITVVDSRYPTTTVTPTTTISTTASTTSTPTTTTTAAGKGTAKRSLPVDENEHMDFDELKRRKMKMLEES